MSRPILHFAHANSFPAGTYRALFHHLAPHYTVKALPIHAHDARYPVRNGWRELARELRDDVARRYAEPVILAGHSLGGLLALMAAQAAPNAVRCVVLLDSPLVAGWRAAFLKLSKLTGTDMLYSPARLSARRRATWPDQEKAYQHFASKAVFQRWPGEVLRDYVEHGTEPDGAGVRLRFRPEIETRIYRTLPHHLGKLAKSPFPVPVGFIGGRESVECRMAGLAATRRLVGKHFVQVPGTHLFPMEHPGQTAEAMHQMVATLLRHRGNPSETIRSHEST